MQTLWITLGRGYRRGCSVFGLVVLAAGVVAAQENESGYRSDDRRECPVLDMPFRSSSGLALDYAFPAATTAAGWGDLGVVELNAWWRVGNWENESGGDLDLGIHVDTMVLTMSADDSGYPLTMARFVLRWSQRFVAGHGFEVDASPGLYSSLDSVVGADWAVPFCFRYIRALNSDFACFAGAAVYPTFDHVVDPVIGVRYSWRDNLVLDLGYPDSRLILRPHPDLVFTAGFGVRLWPEFNMGDDPRERLYYDEMRASGTIELGMTESLSLVLQGGYLMGREISFEAETPDILIDDGVFAGVGLNGRF